MKSYLINLASANARLERMTAIFGALDIAFQRFDAVDGKRARSHPIFTQMPAPKYRAWSDGELGCLLSHYEVWKLIAEGADEFGAVFEDDIHVSPRLKNVLEALIPTGADIVKLETHSNTGYRTAPEANVGGVGLHRLFEMHYGTAGYIISRSAARTLLSRAEWFDVPVDHLLFEPMHPASRDFAVLQCVPGLVVQDDALPADRRQGGAMATGMSGRKQEAPVRPLLERISRFPRSGARRVDRLLHPVTGGTIPFAGTGS